MRKKMLLYLIPFVLIFSILFSCHHQPAPATPSATVEQFRKDVAMLMEELSSKMNWGDQRIAVGLGHFFYGDSMMSSEFAYHFASEVENVITNMPDFMLINRSRLDEILNELGMQISDLVDKETAKSIGKIRGLDAILTGRYSKWEDRVRVKLELTRIEDTKTVVVTRLVGGIPANVAIEPPDYEVQRQRIGKVQDVLPPRQEVKEQVSNSDFRITIEPERMDAYREGDELKLYVKSEVDCYIEIYNISQDGLTQLVFPNEYWLSIHSPNDNFIKAGVRTLIPYDSSFNLKISPPYGIETLKLIASTRPFQVHSSSFYQERGAFPEIGKIDQTGTLEGLKTRAISVEPAARVAQSYCTILTEP